MTDRLTKALNIIKSAYKGLDDNGVHTLDKSLVGDDLKFDFAMHTISEAIGNGQITEEKFIEHITYKVAEGLAPTPTPAATPTHRQLTITTASCFAIFLIALYLDSIGAF